MDHTQYLGRILIRFKDGKARCPAEFSLHYTWYPRSARYVYETANMYIYGVRVLT
jgi:hypothetical protein